MDSGGDVGEGERRRTRQAKKDGSSQGHCIRQDVRIATRPSGSVGQLNAAFWLNCSHWKRKRSRFLIQETSSHSLSTDCLWAQNRTGSTTKSPGERLRYRRLPLAIPALHNRLLCLKKIYGFKWIQLGGQYSREKGVLPATGSLLPWLFKEVEATKWGNKKINQTFLYLEGPTHLPLKGIF